MATPYDVLIIGTGVSGLAAAMYSGRFQLRTAIIGEMTGGTIITTDDVANYPGFKNISGMDLAERIKEHALEYKIDLIEEKVTAVVKLKNGLFRATADGKDYESKTVIFATGTKWRTLDVPGEKEFLNKGVHYCALCDGAFYQDKAVAVIGGSYSAAKDALVLTQYASKVFMIYRKDKIRAEPINLQRVLSDKKITVITNTNVTEIKGDADVKKIMLDKPFNGKKELALDAVFVAVGHIALSDLAKNLGVKLNDKGEIIIDRQAKTNVPGIFAAGDVVDTNFKQAITGVAEGVLASYAAYSFIGENSGK